jgi:hypothetical protein
VLDDVGGDANQAVLNLEALDGPQNVQVHSIVSYLICSL